MTTTKKQSIAGRRGANVVWTTVENLYLVTDREHFLFDERALAPVTEEWIDSIDKHGIDTPLTFAKLVIGGEKRNAIVTGRRRLLGAIEADKRRAARGEPAVEVPAILVKGTDKELFARYVIENELREDDSPLAKAQKVKRYLDLIALAPETGYTSEDKVKAAEVFGVTVKTIESRLKLLTTAPKVQQAVSEGRLGWWAASEFAGLPVEEQEKALEEAITTAAVEGKKVDVEGAKRAANKGDARRRERLTKTLAGLKEAALVYGSARSDEAGIAEAKEELLKAALDYYRIVEKK